MKQKIKLNTDITQLLNEAWLNLGDTTQLVLDDPLKILEQDKDYWGITPLRAMRNPDYIAYACKTLLGINLLPLQAAILREMWLRPFPMYIAARGFGKSFLMAVYCMLKMALTPKSKHGGAGVKIVIVGAAFRQAKLIFEYMEVIWRNAPRLRSVCDSRSGPRKDVDRCTITIGENWTIAIPLGDGSKIRGLRANVIVADEFASIPPDIYETVVQGFASVSSDPIGNVKEYAKRKLSKEMGVWSSSDEEHFAMKDGNQIIISGTASFDFEHFADYWKRYKSIIESQGDPDKLRELFPEGVPDGFSWKDYSIMRIPYELVPPGFLDEKVLIRAKATVHSGIFAKEYGAVFTKDSTGFFRRSLIESCVASEVNLESEYWPPYCPNTFDATTRGNPDKKYIYAIDPASEVDNFCIVILEAAAEHSKVVYCWTTQRSEHRRRLKAKTTSEDDFYGYCARKIRDLMRVFPCERIGMDKMGGGVAVMEALHDKDKLMTGEVPIWPIIDDSKPSDTDHEHGLHIVELVQFANYDWIRDANNGMKKDLEDKALLFPRFDPLTLELAIAEDKIRVESFQDKNPGKSLVLHDTLEDCVMEIEEMKDEMTTIILTKTGTGVNSRDRWDTPEIKQDTGKKGRLRKDRYSALLMGNMLARQSRRQPSAVEYDAVGGAMIDMPNKADGDYYITAPTWYKDGMNNLLNEI